MEYYRIYFRTKNNIDYAYSKIQLKAIIGNYPNKVRRIELCLDNKIIKTYKSLDEVLKGGGV